MTPCQNGPRRRHCGFGQLVCRIRVAHLDGHRESFVSQGSRDTPAPRYFTAANASADFARITETPAAAAKDVHHPTGESTQGGKNAFPFSARQAACQHVKHSRPGSDGEQNRRSQENKKFCRVYHDHSILVDRSPEPRQTSDSTFRPMASTTACPSLLSPPLLANTPAENICLHSIAATGLNSADCRVARSGRAYSPRPSGPNR